ncbi:MAG: leucyl/phenylalanyl-tRNA--protein transferase [Rubrivivax sp.]|nr:leucyl/phenylalanyl-tRNA--protein transferase [Rubrivivax sp.]
MTATAVVHWIDEQTPLPAPGSVTEELPGLVAAGGRLHPARLEEAYRQGLFPWFGPGQPVLWWSPDPRMLLQAAAFKLQRSLRKTLQAFLRTPGCEIVFDRDFPAVMLACASTPRHGQDGTWIVPDMVQAYSAWHRLGRTHSVETWVDGQLVGGLYFVSLGHMVFGESMFSHRTDASKLALAALVAACRARGVAAIDCQQHTGHLASMGAQTVPRTQFLADVSLALGAPDIPDWTYDPAHWAWLDPRLLPGTMARPEDPA